MAHVHCMLVTLGYKHTHRISIIIVFYTATMVTRKRLIVILYTHCLCCYYSSLLIKCGHILTTFQPILPLLECLRQKASL